MTQRCSSRVERAGQVHGDASVPVIVSELGDRAWGPHPCSRMAAPRGPSSSLACANALWTSAGSETSVGLTVTRPHVRRSNAAKPCSSRSRAATAHPSPSRCSVIARPNPRGSTSHDCRSCCSIDEIHCPAFCGSGRRSARVPSRTQCKGVGKLRSLNLRSGTLSIVPREAWRFP